MKVVDEQCDRPPLGEPAEEAGHGLEELEAGGLRIGGCDRSQVVDQLLDLRRDLRDLRDVAAERGAEGLVVDLIEQAVDGLRPGPEGGSAATFVAAAPHDGGAALGAVAGQLLHQPGLADARLAAHQQHASAPRERVVDLGMHGSELVGSSDERQATGGQRAGRASSAPGIEVALTGQVRRLG